MAKTELFSRKTSGGVYVVNNESRTTGNIYFVDSGSSTGGTSAGFGAFPCHCGLSSMCSTAFPLIVLAMMIDGIPLTDFARSDASEICSIL